METLSVVKSSLTVFVKITDHVEVGLKDVHLSVIQTSKLNPAVDQVKTIRAPAQTMVLISATPQAGPLSEAALSGRDFQDG